MTTCAKYSNGHCSYLNMRVELGVCVPCRQNTAPGVWPPVERVPVVGVVAVETLPLIPLDRAVLAHIAQQRPRGCCGDTPPEGL